MSANGFFYSIQHFVAVERHIFRLHFDCFLLFNIVLTPSSKSVQHFDSYRYTLRSTQLLESLAFIFRERWKMFNVFCARLSSTSTANYNLYDFQFLFNAEFSSSFLLAFRFFYNFTATKYDTIILRYSLTPL